MAGFYNIRHWSTAGEANTGTLQNGYVWYGKELYERN